jgi:hypothetical protein
VGVPGKPGSSVRTHRLLVDILSLSMPAVAFSEDHPFTAHESTEFVNTTPPAMKLPTDCTVDADGFAFVADASTIGSFDSYRT